MKSIWALTIVLAFVAGSIATTSPAFADILDQIQQDISELFQRMSDVESQASQATSDVSGLKVLAKGDKGDKGDPGEPASTANPNSVTYQVLTGNTDIISTVAGQTQNNPELLIRVDIDKQGLGAFQIISQHETLLVDIRKDAGAGSCTAGWLKSTDGGTTYSRIRTTSSSSATFDPETTFGNMSMIPSSTVTIAFGLYGTSGDTECSFKNITSQLIIVKPKDYILTQVIP